MSDPDLPGKRPKPARAGSHAAPARPPGARLRRNVWVSGRRTSVSLEIAVWDALLDICRRESLAMDGLCSQVDERRQRSSLASSLRIFALGYFRAIVDRHLRGAARRRDGADGSLTAALARLPRPRERGKDGRRKG